MSIQFEGKVKINPDDWDLCRMPDAPDLEKVLSKYIADVASEAVNSAFEDSGWAEFCGSDKIIFLHGGFAENDGVQFLKWIIPIQDCIDHLDNTDMSRGSEDADFALETARKFREWANEIEAKITD